MEWSNLVQESTYHALTISACILIHGTYDTSRLEIGSYPADSTVLNKEVSLNFNFSYFYRNMALKRNNERIEKGWVVDGGCVFFSYPIKTYSYILLNYQFVKHICYATKKAIKIEGRSSSLLFFFCVD